MSKLIDKVFGLLPVMDKEATFQRFLSKSVFGTVAMRVIQLVFAFMTSLILARWLGPDIYGEYQYLLSWIVIFAAFASLGADELMLKEYPAYEHSKKRELQRGLVVATSSWGLLTGLLMTLLLWGIAESGIYPTLSQFKDTFRVLVWSLPAISVIAYTSSALQVKGKILTSQWPEKLVRPVVFALLVLVCWIQNYQASSLAVVYIWTATSVLAASIMLAQYWYTFKDFYEKTATRIYDLIAWRNQVFLFFLLPLLNVLHSRVDNLILMQLLDAEAVGVYNIAVRIGELVSLPVVIFQLVFASLYAKYQYEDQRKKLEKLLRGGALISTLMALPIFITLIFAGKWVIGFYGNAFLPAYIPMVIISCGQFVYMMIGAFALLLMMTGHSKKVMFVMVVGLILSILSQLILIPTYDIIGAAWAKAGTFICMQMAYTLLVVRYLKVWPTVFSYLKK